MNDSKDCHLPIGVGLELVFIDIGFDHVFTQFSNMINKGFDDENTPIKGENENDFKKIYEL